MKCYICNANTFVKDSRPMKDASVKRHRECCGCKIRFCTEEKIVIGGHTKGRYERFANKIRSLHTQMAVLVTQLDEIEEENKDG